MNRIIFAIFLATTAFFPRGGYAISDSAGVAVDDRVVQETRMRDAGIPPGEMNNFRAADKALRAAVGAGYTGDNLRAAKEIIEGVGLGAAAVTAANLPVAAAIIAIGAGHPAVTADNVAAAHAIITYGGGVVAVTAVNVPLAVAILALGGAAPTDVTAVKLTAAIDYALGGATPLTLPILNAVAATDGQPWRPAMIAAIQTGFGAQGPGSVPAGIAVFQGIFGGYARYRINYGTAPFGATLAGRFQDLNTKFRVTAPGVGIATNYVVFSALEDDAAVAARVTFVDGTVKP